MISVGSLCTGYAGMEMGLRLAGVAIEPRWFAEVDPGMSQVLKHEHPDVRNVGDIKSVPWELLPHIDLMSSGDPCQSISIAGRHLRPEESRVVAAHLPSSDRDGLAGRDLLRERGQHRLA